MGEIILEIMSEKYIEDYREKYSELMEDLYDFLICMNFNFMIMNLLMISLL